MSLTSFAPVIVVLAISSAIIVPFAIFPETTESFAKAVESTDPGA